jgi:phosphoribosylaminoimidazole-succinocarboxamide synthase
MALFWFGKLGTWCPNHLTGEAPEDVVAPDERDQVRGRSMLVKRLRRCRSRRWCGAIWPAAAGRSTSSRSRSAACRCRPGLHNASKLPEPIFTPATKAEAG